MKIYLKMSERGDKVWLFDEHSHPLGQANDFLKLLQVRGLSPQTLRAYGYDLVAFYRWLAGVSKHIAQIDQKDLLDFVDQQRQGGLRASSINRRLTTIQSFCRYCGSSPAGVRGSPYSSGYYRGRGRDRYLGIGKIRPPKHRLLQIKTPRALIEPLTVNQVRAFLQTIARYRDLCIVYLMLFCGLRSREILQLRMGDVSFDEKCIRVTGKGNKERMLPLPPVVLTAMIKYLKFERPGNDHNPFFFLVLQGRHKGRSMTAAGLRTLFRYRRKNPELKNANAHRWRHTFGTDMARAGSTLPVLQRLMGHSDMRVTLQYINLSMADIAQEFSRATKQIQQRYQEE